MISFVSFFKFHWDLLLANAIPISFLPSVFVGFRIVVPFGFSPVTHEFATLC